MSAREVASRAVAAHNPRDVAQPARASIIRRAQDVPQNDARSRYLAALMRDGPAAYIDGAALTVHAVLTGGTVLPIVVNSGTAVASGVWSPYAHYVLYTAEEFGKRHPRASAAAWRVFWRPLGGILRAGAIDHVVYVNNWLFGTNPDLPASADIGVLTECVTREYPDRAIVIRSINPTLNAEPARALARHGYRFVRSRRVFLASAPGGRDALRRNAREDAALLAGTPYAIVRRRDVLERHVERMAALYRGLYVGKHSQLNAHFSAELFAVTLRQGMLDYAALMRDGRVDGFIAVWSEPRVTVSAILGYDLRQPRERGIYRCLIALAMRDAAARGVPLNLSSGAGRFKSLRGAVPTEEFDAVYDRHLPAWRRAVWCAVQVASDVGARLRAD